MRPNSSVLGYGIANGLTAISAKLYGPVLDGEAPSPGTPFCSASTESSSDRYTVDTESFDLP